MTSIDPRSAAAPPAATARPSHAADKIGQALDRPVVLLGRGGSGTRVLSEAAATTGVFLGNDINVSGDSVEWVRPVYDLAIETCQGGAPDPTWPDRLRDHARGILQDGDWAAPRPWGWKLPETMLILPHVLQAFPEARVVHLVRHPVTMSLRRTHMTSRLNNPIGCAVLPAAYRDIGRPVAKVESDEAWQHNAISWLYQVRQVMQWGRERMTPAQYLELRFEDLCAAPETEQARLSAFLEVPGQTSGTPEKAGPAARIDPARAIGRAGSAGSEADPRAAWVWSLCAQVAERCGYGPVPPAGGRP